jgi:hypothetical protein
MLFPVSDPSGRAAARCLGDGTLAEAHLGRGKFWVPTPTAPTRGPVLSIPTQSRLLQYTEDIAHKPEGCGPQSLVDLRQG